MTTMATAESASDCHNAFAMNGSLKLHFMTWHPTRAPAEATPLAYVPGLAGTADQVFPLLREIPGRTSLAMSLRGRGLSDTPARGYGLWDHVSDVEAVLTDALSSPCVLLGFSIGAVYALGFALKKPERVHALILVDHPPIHGSLPSGWAQEMQTRKIQGRDILEFVRATALERIEREACHEEFWERLPALKCPVLVLRAGRKGDLGSLLTDEDVEGYLARLPQCEVRTIADVGHMMHRERPDTFVHEVSAFISKVDGNSRRGEVSK